jgi:HSP20 family molecular chaperone IbpA
MEREGQTLPVRLYQTDTHLMLAAPMPGLEPEDIGIEISADAVTIRGAAEHEVTRQFSLSSSSSSMFLLHSHSRPLRSQ